MAQYIRYPSLGGSATLTGSATGVPYIMGPLDGAALNRFGATIGSFSLYMQSASATIPGLVSSAAQTYAGVKTFNSAPIINTLSATAPVKTDGSKALVSGSISLTADVTGILPANNITPLSGLNGSVSLTGQVSGILPAANITPLSGLTGSVSLTGQVSGILPASNLPAGTIIGSVSLTGQVSGILPAANLPAGTIIGSVSLTGQVSGILPAANLPVGTVIGSVSLTGQVSGILPVLNGGTGVAAKPPTVVVGSITFSQAATGATYSVTYPAAQGSSSSTVLVNDGFGALTWVSQPGQFYCNVYYPASAANYWSNTNGSTSDFTANGSIPTPTTLVNSRMGTIAKATSSLPGINIASAPRTGTVRVTCTYSILPGSFLTTADWTTTMVETVGSTFIGMHSGNITANSANNIQFPATMVGYFNTTAGNAINLKMQSGTTGPTTVFIGGNIAPSTGSMLTLALEYIT